MGAPASSATKAALQAPQALKRCVPSGGPQALQAPLGILKSADVAALSGGPS